VQAGCKPSASGIGHGRPISREMRRSSGRGPTSCIQTRATSWAGTGWLNSPRLPSKVDSWQRQLQSRSQRLSRAVGFLDEQRQQRLRPRLHPGTAISARPRCRPVGDCGAWSARGGRRRPPLERCRPGADPHPERVGAAGQAGYRELIFPRSGKLPKPSNGLEPLTPFITMETRQ
jgi:hypothetical protein